MITKEDRRQILVFRTAIREAIDKIDNTHLRQQLLFGNGYCEGLLERLNSDLEQFVPRDLGGKTPEEVLNESDA